MKTSFLFVSVTGIQFFVSSCCENDSEGKTNLEFTADLEFQDSVQNS